MPRLGRSVGAEPDVHRRPVPPRLRERSTYAGGFTDCPNYLVTASTIEGPWSEPVLLHARGFDASLFHEGDESWLVNLVHDWRPGHGGSAGLEATRYDRPVRACRRPRADRATAGGWIEGPNLYRRGDLVLPDDRGRRHRLSAPGHRFRSRSLTGPYERDPHGPLITARDHPELPLQKAGHGSLVETASGEWYLAYLVARPHSHPGPCVLGRETALARVTWAAEAGPAQPPVCPRRRFRRRPARCPADPAPAPAERARTVRRIRRAPPSGPLVHAAAPRGGGLGSPLTERPSHLRLRGGRSPRSMSGAALWRAGYGPLRLRGDAGLRPRGYSTWPGSPPTTTARTGTSYTPPRTMTWPCCAWPAATVVGLTLLERPGHPSEMPNGCASGWTSTGPSCASATTRARLADHGTAFDATVLSDEHAEVIEDGQIRPSDSPARSSACGPGT